MEKKIILRLGGWASTALRLVWNDTGENSGYIVERLEGKTWERVVWIGDPKLTTCRIENLDPSTEYCFRVIPFRYDTNYKEERQEEAQIIGKTPPASVSVLTGTSTATTVKLFWKWCDDAQGCILEQKEKDNWKRIARITDKKRESWKICGLQPNSNYEFRIKTFSFWGNMPLYSFYKNVSVMTHKKEMEGGA